MGRAGASRVRRGCSVLGLRAGDRSGGEGAGLPERDQLFQAAENAREDRRDQGVQCGRQPGARLLCRIGGLETGDLGAQGG